MSPAKTYLTDEPRITVVVVGYNSALYLEDCLGSLYQSSYRNYDAIFVDNNSTDGTADDVAKHYPQATLLCQKTNLGFAAGNNVGIALALKEGADYVLLLNHDTLMAKDCLERLAEEARDDRLLQPLVLLHRDGQKTDLINTDGNILHYLGFSYCGGYLKPRASAGSLPKKIALGSGAALLIPANILRKIGSFDETFFMYHEDLDLCWRASIAGASIYNVPDSVIWHKYSFGRNKNKMYYAERNRLLFLGKNYQLRTLLLIAPALLVTELAMLAFSLLEGYFPEKLRSYGGALAQAGHIARERRRVAGLRTVSDRSLKSSLSWEISFSEVSSLPVKAYGLILGIYWAAIRIFI